MHLYLAYIFDIIFLNYAVFRSRKSVQIYSEQATENMTAELNHLCRVIALSAEA